MCEKEQRLLEHETKKLHRQVCGILGGCHLNKGL